MRESPGDREVIDYQLAKGGVPMLTRAIVVTFGIALATVPGAAQTDHRQHHTEGQNSSSMMTPGMMMGCPFLNSPGMEGGMMGMGNIAMMNRGMMGMGNSGMMNHDMMGMPSAQRLISMKEKLNLSEAQLANLETLASRVSTAVENHMDRAMAARDRATEIFNRNAGEFDEYGEVLRSAATHMAEIHIAMARSGFEAQSLLTPKQKEVVSSASSDTNGMRGGMMMGRETTGGSGSHGPGPMQG